MKHAFLVLAAGKSSRFGGYPKAFCKVGDTYVAQRTVDFGSRYFDETYFVINNEIYPTYKDKVVGCKTLEIATGQGDAHSFLRAARLIKQDCGAERITLCWGDTFYLEDSIFEKASKSEIGKDIVGISLASVDSEPYAWYETDRDIITASHFRKSDEAVKSGIHDQSVFVFKLDLICSQLESYMKNLNINDKQDYVDKSVSKEMKLLDSFTYFYKSHLLPMKVSLVEPGKSYSFNTHEELEAVRRRVGR